MRIARCQAHGCGFEYTVEPDAAATCPRCGSTGSGADLTSDHQDSPEPAEPAATGPFAGTAGTIGRFVVRARLGSGAFGDVYRAYDPQLDREVALKVARPGSLDSPERAGRFLREGRAAANLHHPHIVPVFDSGVEGDVHFIASGLIEGHALDAELADAGGRPIALPRALGVVRKLADALAYAHRQGVVHRDVKPANVLIDPAGEPSLGDFGLAMRTGDEAVQTTDGRILGSPAYMSPEQAAGRSANATAASDQYALGVMLYELATGHRPFTGPVERVLAQQIGDEPRRPGALNRSIPRDLETIILKCLEKEPAARYRSCAELAEDLRRFEAGEPVSARPLSRIQWAVRWSRRNPVVSSLLAVIVLVSVIGGTVSYLNYRRAVDNETFALGEAERADKETIEARTQRGIALEKADLASKEAKRANDNGDRAVKEAAAAVRAKDAADAARRRAERVAYAALVAQANGIHRTGHNLQALALLDSSNWETRGWEYGWLRRRMERSIALVGPAGGAGARASFSPDGTRVLTSGEDSVARIWNAATGREELALLGHTGRIRAAAFSADGTRIVTASDDAMARVWDAATGRSVAILTGHARPILAAGISSDGSRVATISADITTRLWSVADSREIARSRFRFLSPSQELFAGFLAGGQSVLLTGLSGESRIWNPDGDDVRLELPGRRSVGIARVSPRGDRLLAGIGDGTVQVHDPKTGKVLASFEEHPKGSVLGGGAILAANYSPDGRLAATAGTENVFRVWHAASGREFRVFKGHTGIVRCVCFSPDGLRLASGADDGTARVWEAATGRELSVLVAYTDFVDSVAFSGDGSRLLTTSRKGSPRIWDLANDRSEPEFDGPDRGYWPAWSVSPDGSRVVLRGEDNVTRLIETANRRAIAALTGDAGGFSPDGTRVLTSGKSEIPRVWDLATGRLVSELKSHGPGPAQVRFFSPGGKRLIVEGADHFLRLWDGETGAEIAVLAQHVIEKSQQFQHRVVISAGGKFVVVDPGSRKPREIRETATGRLVGTMDGASPVFAISADGSRVAAEVSPEVRILDAASGKKLQSVRHPSTDPFALNAQLEFSPDGRLLLMTEGNFGVQPRLWDHAAGREVVLDGHTGRFREKTKGKFSPDGRRVLTWGPEGTARLWTNEGKPLVVMTGHRGKIGAAGFSPNGLRVATAGHDGTVRIWDTETGRELIALTGFSETEYAEREVRFSTDGGRLIASVAGVTRIYDGRFEHEVASLTRPLASVAAVFSSDSRRVLLQDAKGDQVGVMDVPEVVFPDTLPPTDLSRGGTASPDRRFEVKLDPGTVRILARSPGTVGVDPVVRRSPPGANRPFDWALANAALGEAAEHWAPAAVHRERLSRLVPWDPDSRLDAAAAWLRADQPARAATQLVSLPSPFLAEPECLLVGNGLRAELYAGSNFDRFVKTRLDRRISWDWQARAPDPDLPADRFSIRWTGAIHAPRAGRYTLEFFADDGVRLWIDGKPVLDEWRAPQRNLFRTEVELTGRSQSIRIDYSENDGYALAQLRWIPPGEKTVEIVPSSCLLPHFVPEDMHLAPPPRALPGRLAN